MREAQYPKEGYIFRHKVNTDTFARVLYLAEGENLDDWEEITEAEYEAEQENMTILAENMAILKAEE